MEVCTFCERPATEEHHLIFGRGNRPIADRDRIVIPVCRYCHEWANKPEDRIHGNNIAMKMSKMLGEYMYITRQLYTETELEACKEKFRERYGRNYL